ncbi:hypothetical protein [Sinomonas sp. ASV322]|uniref:hypothetical protein n=1 Tax=Sinomonas sp. ASV322 TaxID=3041920 RepID=UPI0027DBCB3C|nr:hypothetical protein [Sinomonas sp. ASV322]MDQ4502937.1 hypothetical protein [Sinomonas sp. ASV322]
MAAVTTLIVTGSAIVVVAPNAIITAFLDGSRRNLSPSKFVVGPGATADWAYSVEGLHDETKNLCGPDKIDCKEGYRGDRLTLLRFDSKDKAQDYAASLGSNGYQSHWLVADFSHAPLGATDRLRVKRVLDETWGSESD